MSEKWIDKKVKDLCLLGRGRVISSMEISNNLGVYPVYSSQSQNDGEMGRINTFDFEGEYVTWTTDGAYAGTVFYRNGKFNCTNVCGTLKEKNKDELDLKFLAYLLSTVSKKHVSYVGNPKLMNGIMAEIYLRYPKLKTEQTQIAIILSTLDKAIISAQQLIAKYQRIKTGLLHDLLAFGIDEKGNLRNEKTHQFKDSKLGRIPLQWEPSTIGKSCFVRNEFRLPLSQDVRAKMQGDYRYYGPTGVFDYINEYRVEGRYILIGEDGDHFLKYKNQEQTILVEGEFNVNNHAHILEGSKECSTDWIHLFFSHRDITLHLTRQGAGRYKLNKTSLLNLDIALPKPNEQMEILKRINAIKGKTEQDQLHLAKLQSLKTGLMQDLLSGKVRVK